MKTLEDYSLSRAIVSLATVGVPKGAELEMSAQLERSLPKRVAAMRSGTLVPGSAFATRDLTTGAGSGKASVGKAVEQRSGILGWSTVIRAGAELLGPFEASDVSIFHDTNLPNAQWLADTGSITPADVNFTSSTLSAKRLGCQVIVSRQLLTQYGGTPSLDTFLAAKMKVAIGSKLDQAALYGSGGLQPLGVLNTVGVQAPAIPSPPTWTDLCKLRYAVSNFDANRDSFGFITSPQGRSYFEQTARLTGGGITIWDAIDDVTQESLEVGDGRLFAGLFSYLAIGYWGGSAADGGPAVDVVVDQYSRATQGEVILTASCFCDVAVRWPALFGYSPTNLFP